MLERDLPQPAQIRPVSTTWLNGWDKGLLHQTYTCVPFSATSNVNDAPAARLDRAGVPHNVLAAGAFTVAYNHGGNVRPHATEV